MKISYNWLSQYLSEIPDPEETAERLTLTGLEVEETESTGSDFQGIVVGEVLEVQPHPDADKLVVCHVDTGNKEPSQIVCGAPNVAAGQKVPVATVGAVLPKPLPDGTPFKIKKAKIRGQKSFGMICAEDELGLSDDHTGIMVLDDRTTPGTPFADLVGSSRDTVFEIGLTPNRPDATCHLGVARDLAAATGADLKKPLDNLPEPEANLNDGTIRITDTDKCHRYVGILMRGIRIGQSPNWLKNYLVSIGLRPRNNVVDITNYILHELGQPLHAFDYKNLAGGQIDVRSYDSDITFTTLDDVERTVPAGSLFICDAEKPVALAGVMGGLNSEISEQTTDILIESAWFEPVGIRKTARSLALQTDSSYRFERGVDPSITRLAALRCAGLIREHCGGTIEGISDVHPVKTSPLKVTLRKPRLTQILGVEIPGEKTVSILNKLEILSEPSQENGETKWICTVPTFRPDITTEIDLIEEVARIYDYNNIPDPERITIANPQPVPFHETFREKVRNAAVASGLKEIYTNSLLPERLLDAAGGEHTVIPTLNPITKDQALLRTDLKYGFLRSASFNFNRSVPGVRFFEIGNIFKKDEKGGSWIPGIHESTHLHIGIAGKNHADHWKESARDVDLFDLKALVISVLRQLGLEDRVQWKVSGQGLSLLASSDDNQTRIGTLESAGEDWKKLTDVEKPAFTAELDITLLEQLAEQGSRRIYQPVSRFPSFEYDLALVVDKSVPAGDLEQKMYETAGHQLRSVEVFDVFEGGSLKKHQKSVAFRLTFQDNDKTLTAKDVDPVIQQILKKLKSDFSAELRS